MKFSNWSNRIQREFGIIDLMKDLGGASASEGRPLYMLGGGNPAGIPEMERYFRKQMRYLMKNGDEFERLAGKYAGPQGSERFVHAVAGLFRETYGWEIGPQNVAITNGSQMAFTILFKLFSGHFPDGRTKRIFLPMVHEYIGYNEADEESSRFQSAKPKIRHISDHEFKYEIDFDALDITEEIGAICISRPTNPTGNMISDEEVRKLETIARNNDIPLIIDGAYGLPFPGDRILKCIRIVGSKRSLDAQSVEAWVARNPYRHHSCCSRDYRAFYLRKCNHDIGKR